VKNHDTAPPRVGNDSDGNKSDGLLQRVQAQVSHNPKYKTLTQNELKVYMSCVVHADSVDCCCWPGLTLLAKEGGFTTQAAARARTALIAKRLLRLVDKGGKGHRDVFVGTNGRVAKNINTTVVEVRRWKGKRSTASGTGRVPAVVREEYR
jgi:hypothetical protein